MTDRITGLIGLILAVTYGMLGAGYKSMVMTDPLGPSAFPVLLSVLLAICCFVMVIRPSSDAVTWPALPVWSKTIAAVLAMVAYGFILEAVGFIVASFLLVAVLVWLMEGTALQSVATGIVASALLYLVFDQLFGLPLPGLPPIGLGSW